MEVRSFLGLAGYYKRFVEGFSSLSALLTKFTQKATKFQWTDACERSFQALKDILTSAPVLTLLEGTDGYAIYCDASCIGLGCVLMQHGLRQQVMGEAHYSRYSIHLGATKMYYDIGGIYWWDIMKKDIAEFVAQLTKSAHFLSVGTTYSAEDYARLYIKEIIRLHGVVISIISDRDAQFTANFWRSFQKGLGTQVSLSTTFHPQTDGQAERTIQIVENMLWACVMDFRGSWDDHLPLIEFAYNNSYHSSIQMAPYEALYGQKCRSHIGWFEVGETKLVGPELLQQEVEKIKLIRERLGV
ncbi:uncharacterized protein [Nicotiana tomentosiformis]|uniref:uncharacterized protein n=1 Tax=Nicotiana tomentosiformis TaxID=4098 RepID=UPI00388C5F22